jgi:hypothetical protein
MKAAIHLHGNPTVETELATIPGPGGLLDLDGLLWRVVESVTGETVNLYCVPAAEGLAAELAAWGQPAATVEPATKQGGLFE